MAITLNQPNLTAILNRYYADMLLNLTDKNIYDQSKYAIGLKSPKLGPVLNTAIPQTNGGSFLALGTYFYVVVAEFANEDSMASLEVSATLTGFQNSAFLTWAIVPNAIGYKVYRATVSGQYANSLVATIIGGGISTYLDTGILTSFGTPVAFQLQITGNVTPPAAYEINVFLSSKGNVAKQIDTIDTDPNGNFKFNFNPLSGTNEVYVTVSGQGRSESVYVNSYNIHLFLEMIGQDMLDNWQTALQRAWITPQLFPAQDLFSSAIVKSSDADFKDAWGAFTSVVDCAALNGNYRTFVQSVLGIYKKATTVEALKEIYALYDFGRFDINFIPYDEDNTACKLGTSLKFFVTRPMVGNPSLVYNWNGANIYFNGQRGYVPPGSATVVDPTQGWTAVYIDGTRDVNGNFNVFALDQSAGGALELSGLPPNVLVLAVIVTNFVNDIINIAGMGRLTSVSSPWKGPGNGPYKCGPTFICNGARLNSRGYKYSRMMIWMGATGGPIDSVLVNSIIALFKDVKPAKRTIILGIGGGLGFTEI